MEVVRPQLIIVSAGVDNRFGHPHPEVLERAQAIGAAVLRTDELGAIDGDPRMGRRCGGRRGQNS
ncbi:MAG: hypothetical protein M5U34_48410 [Chloroflexi bacterium]|nr:hypothetical protein [Chloroflexota bacterium]